MSESRYNNGSRYSGGSNGASGRTSRYNSGSGPSSSRAPQEQHGGYAGYESGHGAYGGGYGGYEGGYNGYDNGHGGFDGGHDRGYYKRSYKSGPGSSRYQAAAVATATAATGAVPPPPPAVTPTSKSMASPVAAPAVVTVEDTVLSRLRSEGDALDAQLQELHFATFCGALELDLLTSQNDKDLLNVRLTQENLDSLLLDSGSR